MNPLATICKDQKTYFQPKKRNPSKLVSCWSEKDDLNGETIDAFVIIFRTRGCSWALQSGCSMCGYFNDSAWQTITSSQLLDQFQQAMNRYQDEPLVKIFTSGSFLDDHEVPLEVQKKILKQLGNKTKKISVESRPEYVTKQKLETIKPLLTNASFEVGIGLETAQDTTRKLTINKGFSLSDFQTAANLLKTYGFLLKTYVLVKPPFLTEQEAIQDSIDTIDTIADISDRISVNPTNVQRYTLVEYLWKRGQYRPPWLWSVIEILKTSKQNHPNLHIQCDVAGGGKPRGAHNCKQCDTTILQKIKQFSLTQNIDVFTDLNCKCKHQWQIQLEIEPLSFGSITDTQRWKNL